jgi:hypothetical protein
VAIVNEIQVGRFNGLLHKLLAMKEGAPSPSLAPELVAAVVLEHDRPEYSFLAGEIRAACPILQTSAAAGRIRHELRNPADSGVLCVVDRIDVSTTLSIQNLQVRIANTLSEAVLAEGTVPAIALDLRAAQPNNTAPQPVFGSFDRVNADPGGSAIVYQIQTSNSGSGWYFDLMARNPVILAPGTQMFVVWTTSAASQSLFSNFLFRTRPLEPSETR